MQCHKLTVQILLRIQLIGGGSLNLKTEKKSQEKKHFLPIIDMIVSMFSLNIWLISQTIPQ